MQNFKGYFYIFTKHCTSLRSKRQQSSTSAVGLVPVVMITGYCSLRKHCSAKRISQGFEILWHDKYVHNELCFTPQPDLQKEWDQLRNKHVRIQFSTKGSVRTIRTCESDLLMWAPKCTWRMKCAQTTLWLGRTEVQGRLSIVNCALPGCWLITADEDSCTSAKHNMYIPKPCCEVVS